MDGLIGVQDIVRILSRKGYVYFEDDSKPFNLNIVGIRTEDNSSNNFNDLITMFWKYNGHWSLLKFKATTDPGLYWRENPINIEGTAIFKPQQCRGMWKLGTHKGEIAFQQIKPCIVIRDTDKDKILDFDAEKEEEGLFGINGHNANNNLESTQVDKWSAGCQVWANPHEHYIAMKIAEMAIKYWSNSFTYTLIEENDF